MGSEQPYVHCWQGYRDLLHETLGQGEGEARFIEERLGGRRGDMTCLLPAGHDGPHEWTDDGDIRVRFK